MVKKNEIMSSSDCQISQTESSDLSVLNISQALAILMHSEKTSSMFQTTKIT